MAAGAFQRRRQMADGDRAEPPLGHRRLAGIVDDERVDHRQAARSATGAQAADSATALPGSHSSVPWVPRCSTHGCAPARAATDRRPRRRAAAAGRDRDRTPGGRPRRAAIGLHRENKTAAPRVADHERAAGHRRVRRRLAPGGEDAIRACPPAVWRTAPRIRRSVSTGVGRRNCASAAGASSPVCVSLRAEQRQIASRLAKLSSPTACPTCAAAGAGIIRQHDGDAPLRRRCGGQPRPAQRRGRRRVRCPRPSGRMHRARRIPGPATARRFGLERHGGGQQPSVEFRQHHLHRQVGLREAARRAGPGRPRRPRQHQLQHRHAGRVQRRGAVRRGAEGGGVQHHRQAARRAAARRRSPRPPAPSGWTHKARARRSRARASAAASASTGAMSPASRCAR